MHSIPTLTSFHPDPSCPEPYSGALDHHDMWVNLLITPKSHHPLPLTTSWYFFPTYIYVDLIKLQHPHPQALNSEAVVLNLKGYRFIDYENHRTQVFFPDSLLGTGIRVTEVKGTDASKAPGTGMSWPE